MTTSGADVATKDKKIITLKRTISASAARMLESEILDFLVELDPDNFYDNDFETFQQFIGDLEYLGEGELKARHSKTAAKITARQWYNANKDKVKKMAKKRKTKGAKKKQETMAKSKRTLTGKDKRQYNTKGHLSDSMLREIHKKARDRVDEMFRPDRYLVIKPFTMGKVEATYGELLEYYGGNIFVLHKRGGNRFQFELSEGAKLTGLVKPEDEVTVEDYV